MTTKAQLLRLFKESTPSWRSEATRYRYPRLVERFIDYVGAKPSYTKADAIRFLNHILNSGLSKNYARWSAYVLKQFYESLDLDFPLKATDLPQIEPGDVVAPLFGTEYIRSLIDAVKRKGDPKARAYLALSTAFGPRRSELASLSTKNINNGTITIKTMKHGEPRHLVIPEEVRPYITIYKFTPTHPQTMTNLFKRIQLLAGYKHGVHDGWHGIRRSLVTNLMSNGVQPHLVWAFMGWKLSSRLGILGEYTRPDPEVVQQVCYEKHPFLPLWR